MRLERVTSHEQLRDGTKILFTFRGATVLGVATRTSENPQFYFICSHVSELDGEHTLEAALAGMPYAWSASNYTAEDPNRYLSSSGIHGLRIRVYDGNQT